MILELLNSLAVSFDLPILEWIRLNMNSPFFDKFWSFITLFGDAGIFWIALSVLFLFFRRTRRTGLGMGLALAMGLLICNVIMKPAVGRIRPYDFQEGLGVMIPLITDRMHDFSFPSGHTIASFEASVVIFKNHKLPGVAAIILAVLIAFSRLYLYVHYPTDVIVSIVLGTCFAFIGNWAAGKLLKGNTYGRGKYERAK